MNTVLRQGGIAVNEADLLDLAIIGDMKSIWLRKVNWNGNTYSGD